MASREGAEQAHFGSHSSSSPTTRFFISESQIGERHRTHFLEICKNEMRTGKNMPDSPGLLLPWGGRHPRPAEFVALVSGNSRWPTPSDGAGSRGVPIRRRGSATNMKPGKEMPVVELRQPFAAFFLLPFQLKGTSSKKPSLATQSREAAPPVPIP